MSTHLYLECQEHDPPIRSSSEVGQHLSDLDDVRKMFEARDAMVAAVRAGVGGFGSAWHDAAGHFFFAHPNCRITVRSEYGEEYPI